MDKDAIHDIMKLLDVKTPEAALDRVRVMVEGAPVVGIDASGGMVIAPGMTVGTVLQLLDAGRAAIFNTALTT